MAEEIQEAVQIIRVAYDGIEIAMKVGSGGIAAMQKAVEFLKGITNKHAIFVLTSTKIVNREVLVPFVKENKIKGIINANSSEYFPVNIEDYVVSHSVLETVTDEENNKQLRVLAVAAPENMVRSYYDLAALAGLKVVALDYIGNAMLQLIKTQTTEAMTTMVIQLGSESTVLNIVKGDTLLLQRTVPYGTNVVVNEVMDAKGVDATTAMTLLQNERLLTVDFDDNAITGAFRYLINNIGRVMDFFTSKNPDKPIDDVFLTGDGALIKGIDGLFKVQLNVSTRVMDTLYNIKFDPKIDLKIYNPVYLMVPIGAAFAPMGFELGEAGKKGGASSVDTTPLVIAFLIIAVLVAGGVTAYSFIAKNKAQSELDQVNRDIQAISDIEKIVQDCENAQNIYMDAENMPAPCLSVVTNDCISNAKDYNAGGARYNTNYIQGVGIGTVTDCITAVKYNVFDKKNFTMEELIEAMDHNFEGYDAIYRMVHDRTPKYGNDDDYADGVMQDVFNLYHDLITGRPTMRGGKYGVDMLPTTCHVYFGEVIGATANGRKANVPVSEGISPEKSADTNGPTAVIKSCSKMDHLATAGTLLNQKFTPDVVAGEKGLDNMASLIRSYFAMDGHHIQFNVIDKQTLIEAQKNPDDYRDLIVRVAGYSDFFRNLSKPLQDEIINRTEQSFG